MKAPQQFFKIVFQDVISMHICCIMCIYVWSLLLEDENSGGLDIDKRTDLASVIYWSVNYKIIDIVKFTNCS